VNLADAIGPLCVLSLVTLRNRLPDFRAVRFWDAQVVPTRQTNPKKEVGLDQTRMKKGY